MRASLVWIVALLALTLVGSAVPARVQAADSGEDTSETPPPPPPPFQAPSGSEFMKPRWPSHLSPERHYRRGRVERNTGMGLTVVGSVLGGGGVLLGVGGLVTANNCDEFECLGAAFMVLGGGALLVTSAPFLIPGIYLWRHGHRRMIQARPYLQFEPMDRLPRRRAGLVITGQF